MNKIKKLALKYPGVTNFIVFVIVVVAFGFVIRVVENTFNLDIHFLLRDFIVVLSAIIVSSIVSVKLTKKTKENEKVKVL